MFDIRDLVVVNEAKAGVPISTGIGYFDHMLDQFNSHAQVGVGLSVILNHKDEESKEMKKDDDHNRFSTFNQKDLVAAVGNALGASLKSTFQSLPNASSRFCCPLDEALVECIITTSNNEPNQEGKLNYSLAPYGNFPENVGRTKIGQLETAVIVEFWAGVAKSSGWNITFQKICGDNGHHIVESSFKAFSRALRKLADNPNIWNEDNDNAMASMALQRHGKVERSTKETKINVQLKLNPSNANNEISVNTGITMLNEFFATLAKEASMGLVVDCSGDLWVDDHHTAEDVSIAIGQCWTQALGTKAGLNRMWVASAELGLAHVEVTMDLSNRPCWRHNLSFVEEYVQDLSCEMLEHVLESLIMNGRMTVHIVQKSPGNNMKETALCTAMAFGRAFRICAMVDCRRAGQTASSKGTLSV